MTRILHVRQFVADMLSAADLWLISGGVAVALLLSWLL
jgi:ferredoxin-NADP reductase